jgi:hypothetical protein
MSENEIVVRIPHSLSAAEAQRRIAEGIGAARAQYGQVLKVSKLEWQANQLHFSLSALAQTVQGRVDVEDNFVELRAQLPMLIRMLAKRFLPVIENTGQKLLK